MAFNLFSSHKKESEAEEAENSSAVLSNLSNVTIHTMPKRFLYNKTGSNKKSHGLGLVILIVGAFALVSVFAVLYIYLSGASLEKNNEELDLIDVINKETADENKQNQKLNIDKEKKKEEEILEKTVKNDDENNKKINTDIENKTKIATSTEIKEIEIKIATTTVATGSEKTTFNWRLDIDSDKDGLMDAEEALLGLNKNQKDSDGDTYDDFSEFLNMYNPAGEGKISAHPNIDRYYSSDYFYSFYYPNTWTVENTNNDKALMLKTKNNQFVQIIIVNNTVGSLDDWYKKEFVQTLIRTDRRIYKAGWQGLRSGNDLTAYFQKDGQANIYTISYNLGVEDIWSYKNIFEFILKSFNAD
ncbi:MAG: hypothetical protein U9Q85_02100 [Patescibacteria group bacterium]|nr:hypothetical protein [Patescibacteria group bacterium]